jgi:hypothetical protein
MCDQLDQQMTAMAPGIVQLSIFEAKKKLAKYVKDGNLRR